MNIDKIINPFWVYYFFKSGIMYVEMSKKLTINDIARLSGVSKTTISFYLNGKFDKMSGATKKKIENTIKAYNYQPNFFARKLNDKNSKLIGVLIGDITNSFSNQIVKGIDEAANEFGYKIIVANTNYQHANEKKYIEHLINIGVDGFIVQPTLKFKGFIDKINAAKKHIVFFDSQTTIDKTKWVKTNNYEAVLDTTEELIKCGYDKYILLTADPSVLTTRQERASGFIDCLEMHNKDYLVEIVDNNVTPAMIGTIISKHLSLASKTLIFVANCWLLPIAFLGLKEYKDLMPNTIGLLGFDNTEWTNLATPTITTIVQPAYTEGYKAAKILIDSIEKIGEEPPNQLLKCQVSWQQSTLKK